MASSSTGAREVREPGVCRCCLAVGTFKSMEAVYSWRGRPENYSEMLLEAFSMTLLRETDTASLLICGLCVCRLRDACGFRRQLRECQESFLRLVSPDQINVKLSNFMKIEWKEEPVTVEVTSHYQDEKDADDFTQSDAEDDAPLNTIPQAKAKVPPPLVEAVSAIAPRAGGEMPRNKRTRSVATLKRKHTPATTSKRKILALTTNPEVHTELKEPEVDAVIKSEGKESKAKLSPEAACDRCGETFATPRHARAHAMKAHNECREKRIHMRAVHGVACRERTLYKCRRCGEQFEDILTRKEHIKTAHISKLPCSKCSETFTSRHYRWKHLRAVHGEERIFPCGACGRTYADNQGLVKHQRRVHMMERNYACAQCDRCFFTRNQLQNHAAGHGAERAHECDVCGKRFARRNTMTYHRRIHTGDKRMVCRVCGRAFVQSASLKYHMGRHHPDV